MKRQGASHSQTTQRVALAQRSAVLTLARVANHTETSVQSLNREVRHIPSRSRLPHVRVYHRRSDDRESVEGLATASVRCLMSIEIVTAALYRPELLIKIEAWRYFGLMSTPRAVA